MRAVVQRVKQAQVHVDGELVGSIQQGLLILLGVADGDSDADAQLMADKTVDLRIFEDAEGKMNLSLEQLNGDEDNYPDLISVGDEAVFIAYGRQHAIGDNPFDPPVTFLYLGSKPTAVTSADLNKDGLKDVIILDEALSVAFMHANVAQREFSSTPLEIFTSAGPRQLKTADLDEDGCMDLVARTATGITVLRNQLCD